MPQNDVLEARPTAVVHKLLPHDSARLHVQGSATYIDDIREPEGTLHIAVGMSPAGGGRTEEPRSLGRQRRARRRCRAHRGRYSRQKRHRAGVRRRTPASPSARSCSTDRRCSPSSPGRETRPAAPRGSAEWRSTCETPSVTVADALATGARVQDDYAFGRGDAAGAINDRAASSRWPVHHRRPGAFLSRRPGLFRHSRRRRRDDGPCLDPGSDRDPAHRGARARRARRLRHRRDAPHGRRLRRQGEPGLRLGGDGRTRRAASPAGPARSGSTATTTLR